MVDTGNKQVKTHPENGPLLKQSDIKPADVKKQNDPGKVRKLRIAVNNGKYRVESRLVAEKIVKKKVLELRTRLK